MNAYAGTALWTAVEALVDSTDDLDRLRAHGLDLLAIDRWSATARPIPPELVDEAHLAAARALAVGPVLRAVRAACHGPLVLFKGPEVAARYRDPSRRAYEDLDVLVPNADQAYAELLAAGFRPAGDPARYIGIHHLRPLALPNLPLAIELHAGLKWPDALPAPPIAELIASAVPSATGVAGVLAPSPAEHALILAAHSWAHEPLRAIRDLVDIAAVASEADPAEIDDIAHEWGVERLWRTTFGAAEALLEGAEWRWPLRTWARGLRVGRERTVFETHLERWLSDFAVLPFGAAARNLPRTLAEDLGPKNGETWRSKIARTRRAVRSASLARSQHDRRLV